MKIKLFSKFQLCLFVILSSFLIAGCSSDSSSDSSSDGSDPVAGFCDSCIMSDDFESGTLGAQWVKPTEPAAAPGALEAGDPYDNTPVTVDNAMGADGSTSSMWLDNRTEEGDYWNGSIAREFPEGIRPTYISFYARYKEDYDSSGASYALAVDFHDSLDTGESDDPIYFEIGTDGHYFSTNGDADTDGMALPNTWYHIEFKNIDWEANTYDFYVDGVLIEAGIELYSDEVLDPDLYIRKMTIGSDAGGVDNEQEAWIDQIKIK